MRITRYFLYFISLNAFSIFLTQVCYADPVDELLQKLIKEQGTKVCEKLQPLSEQNCQDLLAGSFSALRGKLSDEQLAVLKEKIKKEISSPELLNSILIKSLNGDVPLALEFKSLDSESGTPVLGLTYSYTHNFLTPPPRPDKDDKWHRTYSMAFSASGTLTQDADDNPDNFLDTKLTLSQTYTTRIPEQSKEFQQKLTQFAFEDAQCDEGQPQTPSCLQARNSGLALLDSTSEYLRAFQRYEYGIDVGYESNQNFDGKLRKLSIYTRAHYEEWGSNSLIGQLKLNPSLRLGIDNISPDSDTHRATAGDDSDYYRLSGMASLWVPVGNFNNTPVVLTFNYRYHHEIDASDVVKNANLESYSLRTYSLAGPNGLFVTYSSGRLPTELVNDEVVAVGWKTYF